MNVEGKILKLERNSLWKLLFYHDLNKATYFNNKTDAYECNEEGRYSKLKTLKNIDKIKGKFEFLLEYPELGKSNQWKQSINPFRQHLNDGENATGYEEIDIQMYDNNWGGLFSYDGDNCLLAGSTDGLWHYAIGTAVNSYDPYFPGPDCGRKIVKLWIKMSTLSNRNSCRKYKRSIDYMLMLCSFILNCS